MKVTLKSLVKVYEDWTSANDFYILFQIDLCFNDCINNTKKFSFEVISPKKLEKTINKNKIELGRGYVFMKDFDINVLKETIGKIIIKCSCNTPDETLNNLSKFFRPENDVVDNLQD